MKSHTGFAAKLRWWRQHRGLSQLELSGRAEISQRHLSFLELGRASASRQMVLRLAEALEVPLRQHNVLLLAAGFAPAWGETELGAPELAQIASAVDYMLAQQEPFPAVAVDRHWNLLKANSAMVRVVEFLVGPLPPGVPVNLADALVAPDVLRPVPGELGGGSALLHPQRGGRCGGRPQRRDRRSPGTAVCIQRCAIGHEECPAGRDEGPGPAHAFPQGRHHAGPFHHDCDPRNATRCHGAGAEGRELLSYGRRHCNGSAGLGGRDKIAALLRAASWIGVRTRLGMLPAAGANCDQIEARDRWMKAAFLSCRPSARGPTPSSEFRHDSGPTRTKPALG